MSGTSMKTINDNLDGTRDIPNLRKVKACGYCTHYLKTSLYCEKFDALIYSTCLCDDFNATSSFGDPNKTGGLNSEQE